jgi:uncharacterized lipoprotein YbaY
MAEVKVSIEWPDHGVELPASAKAHVTVEDVTLADASSVAVAGVVADQLRTDHPMTVVVDVPEVDPSHRYSVRVHVRREGSPNPQVQSGDLITTQSYPVLTRGFGNHVTVKLLKV